MGFRIDVDNPGDYDLVSGLLTDALDIIGRSEIKALVLNLCTFLVVGTDGIHGHTYAAEHVHSSYEPAGKDEHIGVVLLLDALQGDRPVAVDLIGHELAHAWPIHTGSGVHGEDQADERARARGFDPRTPNEAGLVHRLSTSCNRSIQSSSVGEHGFESGED